MQAYLLALEIEPVEVNKVYVALPLHCTVIPWFYASAHPAAVLRAIQSVVANQKPIELISAQADLFGENKDVPVNRLANEQLMKAFHVALCVALESVGAQHKSAEWIGDGYKPHVTRQRSGRFEEGTTFAATKLYLAQAESPERLQQKQIIYKLTLGSD